MTAAERIFLVDAHAYLHRAYHALPPLTTKAGEPVGALYGFARMLLAVIKREKPDFLAVCFDRPEPTFRHKLFKDYKATRKEIDADLVCQLGVAAEMVRRMGIATVEAPGFEADDVIATMTREAREAELDVVIVSGDKDALQLIDARVTVLNEAKGVVYDAGKVNEKLQVGPGQVIDFLALVGDSSDNVPGVPGIGAVGAAKLLARFGTLETVLAAARKGHTGIAPKTAKALLDNEEKVRFGRRLITLDSRAPVELKSRECRFAFKTTPELIELFSRFEFRSLLQELGAPGAVGLHSPGAAGLEGSPAAPAPSPVPEARIVAEGVRHVKAPFRPVTPSDLLKVLRTQRRLALAAVRGEPDLLSPGELLLAVGLRDGRAAVFAGDDLERAKKALAKVLGDEAVEITGHDLKAVIGLLRAAGMPVAGKLHDTMLAAYCLDPARPDYGFTAVLRDAGGAELIEENPGKALAREAAASGVLHARLEAQLKEKGLLKLYRDLELPLLRVLADMEEAGVELDLDHLRRVGDEFVLRIAALKAEIDALAGVEINLNSPKQLGVLLFEKLKLPVVRKTKKGGVSTDEETLRILAGKHPIPDKIIAYRELAKLKSTYVDALLEKADPLTRRVHSHFDQAGTVTGRLSSDHPNLQNIPIRTAEGRKIRRAFRAPMGKVLLCADYSQIDLRVLAHLSGDLALCAAFRNGEDVHLKTASEVFNVPPASVDKEMRRRAKAVNFGIVYGQNAHGLSQGLGIGYGEARDYIRAYFARYRGVEAWLKSNLEAARKDGLVRTLLGRIRYLPDIAARNFSVRSFNERAAGNTPIQGTSADIIKAAMINIHRDMPSEHGARLVLQVHDELVFELPKREVRAFARWVRVRMESAVVLDVPVMVDVKAGPDWDQLETLET